MTTFISILLGVPLGIIASLIAWWILFHCIVPKIDFSEDISKSETTDSASGYRYRIKFINTGKRDILDVEIFARFKVKGLRPNDPNTWSIANLKVIQKRIPRIKTGTNKIIRIRPETTELFFSIPYPSHINDKYSNGILVLEDIMRLGNKNKLQLLIFGYDSFSGARKVFESKIYDLRNVKSGLFKKGELIVDNII